MQVSVSILNKAFSRDSSPSQKEIVIGTQNKLYWPDQLN